MKRNLLIMVIILLFGFVVNSCGDDEKDPPVCNLGAHLGIGETCNGTNCSLQNYNTSIGANAFPKPIYRVGPIGDFNSNSLTKTVNDIMLTYTDPIILGLGGADKLRVEQRLDFVQIYKEGGDYTWNDYTWKDKVLGLPVGLDADYIEMHIGDIASSGNLTPTAQLQPIGNIHIANVNNCMDQFTVIASRDEILPKVIVVNGFEIYNRIIIQNNKI